MADYDDIPDDLIALQRAFWEADDQAAKAASALPLPTDIAAGEAEISDEQHGQLAAAREARLSALEALNRHPWWGAVANAHDARQALRRAARS